MANYLRWLWREDRGAARVLVVAVAVVLACGKASSGTTSPSKT
jgi:Flp pilus assembly pilin Flp